MSGFPPAPSLTDVWVVFPHRLIPEVFQLSIYSLEFRLMETTVLKFNPKHSTPHNSAHTRMSPISMSSKWISATSHSRLFSIRRPPRRSRQL